MPRRALEQDPRKALLAGELELHDRPVINIASDKTSRLEALVRWRHREKGMVSPGSFIPIRGDRIDCADWRMGSGPARATAGACRVGIGAGTA
jgi:predicted signal transduction protein with EAL and GGDEF domain